MIVCFFLVTSRIFNGVVSSKKNVETNMRFPSQGTKVIIHFISHSLYYSRLSITQQTIRRSFIPQNDKEMEHTGF